MLIGLTLFFSLVIATVYRIQLAINTDTGHTIEDAYKVGENYGSKAYDQKGMLDAGWKIKPILDGVIRSGMANKFLAKINIVGGEEVTAKIFFYRASDKNLDFEKELFNKGEFWELETVLPKKGKWIAIYSITTEDGVLSVAKDIMAE